uniref:CCHC-type domain-containing protein n=1 Tax=Manihot esculenta TaxID=3983 RepID=A0A2C9UVA8_MANES
MKESKENLLVRDFELFEMKPGKNISEMNTRYTDLVNLLKALKKSFEEAELVKKILRSLPKSWKAKTTIIFDTKDFTRYTYDELIGSLIAHEMILKKEITEKEKLTDGKKKSIALKIDTNESSSLFSDEEEMAMLARKFRRTFRKGGSKYKRFVKKYGLKEDSLKDPKEIICYECNKADHIRHNCPKSKKKKEDKGKKVMAAVWDTTDESSSDDSNEKNEANLYCMALEEETAEPSKDEEIKVIEFEPPNIEELELAFAKVY